MKKRPLLFTVTAVLHVIEPLIKILYFKATTGFAFINIMDNIFQIESFKNIFEFWLLFPIAGLALIGVKQWSYPIFVSIQAYSVFMHLNYQKFTWPYSSSTPHWYGLGILAFNIAIIAYFLLPDVRRPFFDKGLRWWQIKTRYIQSIPCTIYFNNPEQLEDCNILNISHSGAFIDYQKIHPQNFMKNTPIHMNLSFGSYQITVLAHMVSLHSFDNGKGIGIEFKYLNIFENLYMRRIIKAIAKIKKHEENQVIAA